MCHDPMWSWVGRVPDPSWGWARMCPYLTWSWVRACHGPTLGWAQKKNIAPSWVVISCDDLLNGVGL